MDNQYDGWHFCGDCGSIFEEPDTRRGLSTEPDAQGFHYELDELIAVCPECGATDIALMGDE